MSEFLDFIRDRGELASIAVAALLMGLATVPVARALGIARGRVSDLYWNGAIAFLVAGRAVLLLLEAPGSLLDIPVAIRVTDGIEPLGGALGVVVVLGWQLRHERPSEASAVLSSGAWLWTAAAVAGIAVGTIGYDLACPLRDACYGTTAPPPLGFTMSGLADTRVATPLVEATLLLAGLGLLVGALPRLRPSTIALLLVAGLAGVRLTLLPLGVGGGEGWSGEALLLALLAGSAAVGAASAVRARRPREVVA